MTGVAPCSTSHNKGAEISAVVKVHARRYAVIALIPDEPIGMDRLRALSDRPEGVS